MDLEETEARNDCTGEDQQQFDRPIDSWSCRLVVGSQLSPWGSSWRKYQLKPAVRVWGWREMVATLREREPGNRGTPSVGSRYQAAWLRPLAYMWYWYLKCSHELFECPVNPAINPKPVYRHSNAWQHYLIWCDHHNNVWCITYTGSRDSSVGIATGYGLDDQGWREFESR
jgi:hypothetical protein